MWEGWHSANCTLCETVKRIAPWLDTIHLVPFLLCHESYAYTGSMACMRSPPYPQIGCHFTKVSTLIEESQSQSSQSQEALLSDMCVITWL